MKEISLLLLVRAATLVLVLIPLEVVLLVVVVIPLTVIIAITLLVTTVRRIREVEAAVEDTTIVIARMTGAVLVRTDVREVAVLDVVVLVTIPLPNFRREVTRRTLVLIQTTKLIHDVMTVRITDSLRSVTVRSLVLI